MTPPRAKSAVAGRHPKGDASIADRRAPGVRDRRRLMGPCRGGLVTDRAAARICGVSRGTLHQWVETGAWPLPRAMLVTTLCFVRADVEVWILTGAWPDEARFKGAPR
jgi:predicted DNA-binding transcriptional regulator AlpA